MFGRKSTDMITVKDVPASEFIKAYANHLKTSQKVTPMENAFFIKTGKSRELAPYDEDWFYVRAASLARKIYLRPELGVGTLQHIYGRKCRNGHRKKHAAKGSGKIIRYALQQLSDAGILMRYNDKRNHNADEDIDRDDKNYPRIITPKGQKELNQIAGQVFKKLYQEA